jgi:protein-tyrosine phosphatase
VSGEERTSESDPIRVDFLPQEALELPGHLGMTLAPGKKVEGADGRWNRDLETDLLRLREEYQTEVLVSLMEHAEYSRLQIPDLFQRAEDLGIEVLHLPIPDGRAPLEDPETDDDYGGLIEDIAGRLERGQTVVLHCRGGQGRSGLVAASVLVALGHPAIQALETVRQARKGAVETPDQEERVHWFEMERQAATNSPQED